MEAFLTDLVWLAAVCACGLTAILIVMGGIFFALGSHWQVSSVERIEYSGDRRGLTRQVGPTSRTTGLMPLRSVSAALFPWPERQPMCPITVSACRYASDETTERDSGMILEMTVVEMTDLDDLREVWAAVSEEVAVRKIVMI